MLIGNCGGDGAPACPPESTPFFVAVAVGLPVAIIFGIAGGRFSLIGLFAAAGVSGLWAAGERTGALVVGGASTVIALLPLGAGAVRAAPAPAGRQAGRRGCHRDRHRHRRPGHRDHHQPQPPGRTHPYGSSRRTVHRASRAARPSSPPGWTCRTRESATRSGTTGMTAP